MSFLSNLIAYYKLDESSGNAADASGAGITLTNNNTVTYTNTAGQFLIVRGANFGAGNTNKSLSTANTMGIDGGACSISLWVKMNGADIASSVQVPFQQANTSTQTANQIFYDFNGGTRRLRFQRTKYSVGDQQLDYTITLGTTNFYHLVYTYDGATITGYVNGVSVGTAAASGSGSSGGVSGFRLADSTATGLPASMYIDEVGVWSRALSSTEVSQLYNGGSGVSYTNFNTRYWVGGTGNWDASTKTHWAFTSNGTSGADVPTATESVLFDASSGSGIATVTATANCLDLTCTGYTGTLAGSSAMNVYGSLVLVSGMTYSHTGTLTFSATSSGKTITTNTKAITSPIVFNGVSGGWTFQDSLTHTGSSLTLTNGSVNLNNLNHSCVQFASSNANTRILTMGSGTLSLTGSGTVWDTSTTTNLTLTPNTSTIKLTDATSSSKTFSGGGKTFNNLWITGSGTGAYTIAGSNTFADFKVDTPPHTINFTAATTQTVSTWNVTGSAGNLMTLQSTSSGSQWILASTAILSSDYLSLQDSKGVKL